MTVHYICNIFEIHVMMMCMLFCHYLWPLFMFQGITIFYNICGNQLIQHSLVKFLHLLKWHKLQNTLCASQYPKRKESSQLHDNVEEPATVYEGPKTTGQETKPDYEELAAIKTNDSLTSDAVRCFIFLRMHAPTHLTNGLQGSSTKSTYCKHKFLNGCHKECYAII